MSIDSLDEEQPPRTHATSETDIRHAAIRCLAAREHGYRELLTKLTRKGFARDSVADVLDELGQAGLQSDERFAEIFVRSRSQKAYGPVRIRAELQERGIDKGLIDRALKSEHIDWLALACGWYERRYGSEVIEDSKERAKRQAVLARRGFTHDVIRELLN